MLTPYERARIALLVGGARGSAGDEGEMMTTAKHSSMAYDAEMKADWATAAYHLEQAIAKYPAHHPESQMHKLHIAKLNERLAGAKSCMEA
jgi:hypothetical protein